MAAALLAAAAAPIQAQSIGGFPLPDPAPTDQTGIRDKPPPEHLLSSMAGESKSLDKKGVDLLFEYTGEAAGVVAGGDRKGVDYAGQAHIKADFDLQKLAGLNATSFHLAIVNRHGRNAAGDYLQDHLLQVQEIYGGAGGVGAVAHLVYAYGELSLDGGKVDLEAGRLPVSHDFASSPLYCDFLNTIVCGSPHAEVGDPAFTIFPYSTWGARLRVKPTKGLVVLGGAYQVRPKFGGDSGFNWGFSGTTGVLLPLEVDWLPTFGADALPGHYKIGVTYDTSNYSDLLLDGAGRPFALSGAPPRRRGGRSSAYVLADQMVARAGKGSTSGVVLFGGLVQMDEDSDKIGRILFGGAHLNGVIAARPKDSINLLAGHQSVSDALTATQRLQAAAGRPLQGAPAGIQTSEWLAEANYDAHVTSGLHLIPDLQYIGRPDATAANRSALVAGLRVAVVF